ncbi:MAG: DUF202 domain-containing protein [Nanoarchaeota archaeon]|nr:DUF202 domain-containing protein [Nanoarchaeota archaeon]
MKSVKGVDFDEEEISVGDRASVERTVLSRFRTMLSEERTILAYISAELTFIGVIIVILKFYFEKYPWSIPVALGVIAFFGVIILFEIGIIRNLRLRRRKMQKEHGSLLS